MGIAAINAKIAVLRRQQLLARENGNAKQDKQLEERINDQLGELSALIRERESEVKAR